VVEAPERALRRYPLERVSEVILRGAVETRAAALRACAARGIPVGALDTEGKPLGFFLPWRPTPPPPSQLLENFLQRGDTESRYRDWQRSQQRRAMMRALRAAGIARQEGWRREEAVQALLGQFAQRARAASVLKSWLGLAAAAAQRVLSGLRLCPTLVAGRRRGVDLPADLSEIAAWGHWEALRRMETLPEGWAQEVQAYETQRRRDERLMHAVAEHFLCWLGGVRWQ
jgi:hypothetical protein